MKFWHIDFEGQFTKDSLEYPNEPFFSSCLIQADDYTNAEFIFLQALSERKIKLIEIGENFLVDTDPSEMDYENEDNLFWIKWCEEVELNGKPSFDTFNLYPIEEMETTTKSEN